MMLVITYMNTVLVMLFGDSCEGFQLQKILEVNNLRKNKYITKHLRFFHFCIMSYTSPFNGFREAVHF